VTADYSLRVAGRLTPGILKALEPLDSNETATETVLVAHVADQAALHSLIARIAGLGLKLVELQRLPPNDSANRSCPRWAGKVVPAGNSHANR
jgi:hypothetical protein